MNRDSPDIQARLAALADGTLAPGEQEQLLAQIDSSSELGEDAEAQRHAVAVMSSLESVHAPAELHRSVQVLVAGASHSRHRRPRRRLALRLLAPGALAAAAMAALLIALTSGGSGAPTLLKAADVALAPATLPAPAQSVSRQSELTRSVEGTAYPYWQDSFGWRATGARVDRVAGRMVTTVFYAPQESAHTGAGRIGYAIGGRSPAAPSARWHRDHGQRYRISPAEHPRGDRAHLATRRAHLRPGCPRREQYDAGSSRRLGVAAPLRRCP